MLLLMQRPRTAAFRLVFRATVHWLSEFPQSLLDSDCNLAEFVSIQCIYRLFRLLLNREDFQMVSEMVSVDIGKLFLEPCVVRQQANNELVFTTSFLRQVECIDQLARHHLKVALHQRVVSLDRYAHINWYQVFLVAKEEELYCVLRLLLTIGMQTSKLSTFGLTAINFLDDRDQDCLSAFLRRSYSDAETGGKLDPAIKAALESGSASRNMVPGPEHVKIRWIDQKSLRKSLSIWKH